MTDENDNFDDIDLNELFNDFDETPILSLPKILPTKSSLPKLSDELIEFHENDCTSPSISRPTRKVIRGKRKTISKQTTMYEYASSVSYKNQQFYSSLDNSTTTKMITKGQKRSTKDVLSSIPKKNKTNDQPDFVDRLLEYLDRRSHFSSIKEEKENFSR